MGSKKRSLFAELMEGVEDMRKHREGKITLRTHKVDPPIPLEISADTIRETRDKLRLSRRLFARKLRINERTLEKWEQGRSRPNQQAAALILLVRRDPKILGQLDQLDDVAVG